MKTLTGSRIEITDAIDSSLQSCIVKGTAAGLSSASVTACRENLLRNTGDFQDLSHWTLQKSATSTGTLEIVSDSVKGNVLHYNVSVLGSWIYVQNDFYSYYPALFDTTKQYTLSFDVRTSAGKSFNIMFANGNASHIVCAKNVTTSTSWQRVSYTFTPLETGQFPVLYFGILSIGDYYITNCQLEFGTATPYEPYYGTIYSATPTAALMVGDTYDLVSGMETHSGGTTYQHTPQQIRTYYPYTQIINNAGTDMTVVTLVMDDLITSLPAWRTPKTDWDISGKINISDWQRIDDNIWRIADFYGLSLPYKTWAHTSWPTASEVTRIESNINALLDQTHSFQCKFDWQLLNDIESLLLTLHVRVVEFQLSVRRAGTIRAGQNIYIPIGGVT